MEFADLLHYFLKDKGLSPHIQPHWATPAGSWDINPKIIGPIPNFGPPIVVRAVVMHLENPIIIWFHPITMNVYIKYKRPLSRREKKLKKKKAKMEQNGIYYGGYSYYKTTQIDIYNLSNPEAIEKIYKRILNVELWQRSRRESTKKLDIKIG